MATPVSDNKSVQAMRDRSRTSLEKSAKHYGVKNIGHKNKLQLARGIDRAQKDKRNERERVSRKSQSITSTAKKVHEAQKQGKPANKLTAKMRSRKDWGKGDSEDYYEELRRLHDRAYR